MAHEAAPLDANTIPDVPTLVHEVVRTGQTRLIEADGDVVRVSPARPRRRRTALTPAQREAQLREAFGAWKGLVDAEQLKRDLDAARGSDATLPELGL